MELRGTSNKRTLDTVNEGVKKMGFSSRELVSIILGGLISSLLVFFISKLLVIVYLGLYVWLFLKASKFFKACQKKGINSPLQYQLDRLSRTDSYEQEGDFYEYLKRGKK